MRSIKPWGSPNRPRSSRSRRAIWPLSRLVIESSQVQQPVQDQHLDFDGERMSLFARLAQRRRHADGKIAGHFTGR